MHIVDLLKIYLQSLSLCSPLSICFAESHQQQYKKNLTVPATPSWNPPGSLNLMTRIILFLSLMALRKFALTLKIVALVHSHKILLPLHCNRTVPYKSRNNFVLSSPLIYCRRSCLPNSDILFQLTNRGDTPPHRMTAVIILNLMIPETPFNFGREIKCRIHVMALPCKLVFH